MALPRSFLGQHHMGLPHRVIQLPCDNEYIQSWTSNLSILLVYCHQTLEVTKLKQKLGDPAEVPNGVEPILSCLIVVECLRGLSQFCSCD